MNKRTSLIGIIILLAIIVAIFVFRRNNAPYDNGTNVKIGIILPLSGGASSIGEPKKKGIDLALEEFNAKSPVKISAIFEDSKGNAKDGIFAFQKLLADKSIEHYYIDMTPIVNSTIPLIVENEVISFVGSAEPEVTDRSEFIFRLFPSGRFELQMMVDYLLKSDIKNIFIIHTAEFYGKSAFQFVEREFVQKGGKVSGHEEYAMDNNDFKNILTKISASDAEKIIILGYINEYSHLLRQSAEASIPPSMFLCNLGGSARPVMELPQELIEGLSFVGPKFAFNMLHADLNMPDNEMSVFVDRFTKKYDVRPDFVSAYAYDTINVLSSVFNDPNVDPSDVRSVSEALTKIRDFKGVSGNITFLENGDTKTDLHIASYKNGDIVAEYNDNGFVQ